MRFKGTFKGKGNINRKQQQKRQSRKILKNYCWYDENRRLIRQNDIVEEVEDRLTYMGKIRRGCLEGKEIQKNQPNKQTNKKQH